MTERPPLSITPQTRVGELLEAYPELEGVLVAMAPPFKRLQNPVLRRTIARVTTLERAAAVGGIPLREVILRLREAVGQPTDNLVVPDRDEAPASTEPAAWVDPDQVVWTVDADELLAQGEQPLGVVQRSVRELASPAIGLITSSFLPAPLIEVLERQGYRVSAVSMNAGGFATYVAPAP